MYSHWRTEMIPFPCQFCLAFGFPSGPDMLIIAVLVLVLFGAKKLPLFGQSLGRSMGEFRKMKEDFDQQMREGPKFNRRDPDDGSDSLADMVLLWLFGISIVLFILSFIMPSMR